MPKKSRQKFKYLEYEKSFQDEIKSIFHHFWRTIIEAIFLEGESPSKLKDLYHHLSRLRRSLEKDSERMLSKIDKKAYAKIW